MDPPAMESKWNQATARTNTGMQVMTLSLGPSQRSIKSTKADARIYTRRNYGAVILVSPIVTKTSFHLIADG